jgi:hypothetical protein
MLMAKIISKNFPETYKKYFFYFKVFKPREFIL